MSGPWYAVRVRVEAEHLDEVGHLSHEGRNCILRWLWDVPESVPVFLDLGPLRWVDVGLLRQISERPCARYVRIESPDYLVARAYTEELLACLVPVGGRR